MSKPVLSAESLSAATAAATASAISPSSTSPKAMNKFAFSQRNFIKGISSSSIMDTSSSSAASPTAANTSASHRSGVLKTNNSKSSSVEKTISFSSNISINGLGDADSNDDLKLNIACPEPTTPIDRLNTPRTVTVKQTSFFPPLSPTLVDPDINLTGKTAQSLSTRLK